MHRPPAVAWSLAPARWQGRVLNGLLLLAFLVWAGFFAKQGWGFSSIALLLTLPAGVTLAALARHKTARGQLSWDGEQWHWIGVQDRPVRSMVCVLDFQTMLLLHLTCDQGDGHWLWLESGDKPALWRALRRAIVASSPLSVDEIKPEPQDV
jgi:hypothetical protein